MLLNQDAQPWAQRGLGIIPLVVVHTHTALQPSTKALTQHNKLARADNATPSATV